MSVGLMWIAGLHVGVRVTEAQVKGRVTGEAGAPLVSAEVAHDDGIVVTDAKGEFVLPAAKRPTIGNERLVRVSRGGYRPVSKIVIEGSRADFTLRSDPAATWRIPKCAYAPLRVGASAFRTDFFLNTPGGYRAERIKGGEDVGVRICRGGDCVVHVSSGIAASPIGTVVAHRLVLSARELSERDIVSVDPYRVSGVEYRGTRHDGTQFRWLGFLGERIGYDGVKPPLARLLDEVIESLCRLPGG